MKCLFLSCSQRFTHHVLLAGSEGTGSLTRPTSQDLCPENTAASLEGEFCTLCSKQSWWQRAEARLLPGHSPTSPGATVPAGRGTRPSVPRRRILMTRGIWPCATRTWGWSSLRVQPASFPSPLEDSNSLLSHTSSLRARLRDSLNPGLCPGAVRDPSQSPVPRARVGCCVAAVPGLGCPCSSLS